MEMDGPHSTQYWILYCQADHRSGGSDQPLTLVYLSYLSVPITDAGQAREALQDTLEEEIDPDDLYDMGRVAPGYWACELRPTLRADLERTGGWYTEGERYDLVVTWEDQNRLG